MNMRVGIITINDNDNYGNRLQNYAVQEILKTRNIDSVTLKNVMDLNFKRNFGYRFIKYCMKKVLKREKNEFPGRKEKFEDFNRNIKFSKNYITAYSKINKKFDYFITGSDQVWNPYFFRLSDVDFLCFAEPNKRIAFSASFGLSELSEEKKRLPRKYLNNFKAISVRENAGKNIIEEITERKEIEVLLDPTMMLKSEEWEKIMKEPDEIPQKKYILNYFLGKLSKEKMNEIKRIADENDCEIINILDKNDKYYITGPSEFIYLEKNAFLICTDSFHSSVFAILFNRPFIVFDRVEDGENKMNSRIDTLLDKLNLKNRKFDKKITNKNLNHNYYECYKILEKEREKTNYFLKKALN